MNTPPPSSTSSSTTTTTNNGGGVQAPDGYTTDTEHMSSAGRNIKTKAEDAKGDVKEVQPSTVKAEEFGKHADHQAKQKDYGAAIEQLGNGANAMCDNLVAFAGSLGDAGTSYGNTEDGATQTVSNTGA